MKPTLRLRLAQIARTVGLAVLWAGPALANPALAEDPPYPVWWSPVLELDSLEDIDARLERTFWPGDDEGMPLFKIEADEREDVSAANCIELRLLVDKGYRGAGSHDYWVQEYLLAHCRAIEWMRRARPAKRSFLRDFVLDEEAIHVLPALVDISPSCDFVCRQRVANERPIPLSQFTPVFRITVTSDEEIEIRTLAIETDLSILARGDFNDDGLDDLLLLTSSGATEGTWANAEIYLLSRETPGSVLRVLDAGTATCADYQCEEASDYPEAPKEVEASPPSEITIPVRGSHTPSHLADGPYPVWWSPNPVAGTIGRFDPRPAAKSFLRNLVLGEDALRLLPAPLGFWTSPCVALEAWSYDERGYSWARFNADRAAKRRVPTFADGSVYRLKFLDEQRLQAWALAWVVDIEILAGGDFNGDGFDDILVKRDIRAYVSGYEESDLFVLSRNPPDAVLRIVNVDDLPDSQLHRMAVGAETAADLTTADQCRVGAGDKDGNKGGEVYPVWWSDRLNLQGLDWIGERLQRRFLRPSGGAFQMEKRPGPEGGPVSAENCEELLGYLEADYRIQTDYDLGHWQAMRCRTYLALSSAKPAKDSHLRDFVLDGTSMKFFPALFGETVLRYGPCRLHLYNQLRFALKAYIGDEVTDGRNVFDSSDPTFRIESRSDREIIVTTKYRGARLSIVAGGDINGDGLDDILLEMSRWLYDWEDRDETELPRIYGKINKLFILSRDDPAGVLWVVNADDFLPSKQDCVDWRAETEWSVRQE